MASASNPSKASLLTDRAEQKFSWFTILVVLVILFASRALNVFVCSTIIERMKWGKVRNSHKLIIFFAGLRGAMSRIHYSLSICSRAEEFEPNEGHRDRLLDLQNERNHMLRHNHGNEHGYRAYRELS